MRRLSETGDNEGRLERSGHGCTCFAPRLSLTDVAFHLERYTRARAKAALRVISFYKAVAKFGSCSQGVPAMGACVSSPVADRASTMAAMQTQLSLGSELISSESGESDEIASPASARGPNRKRTNIYSTLSDETLTSMTSPRSPQEQTIPFAKNVTYSELQVATQFFSSNNILGAGSFGNVYKGVMSNLAVELDESASPVSTRPVEVAVKELSQNSRQGNKEYLAEVKVLNRVRHPNLVRLLAHCHEGGRALLAYELCPSGPLDKALQKGVELGKALTWQQRVAVALDVARGLLCLHRHNVIHRDLKASNVLLTEDYSAKVADFGLARGGPIGGQTHVSTKIMGTRGYLDPGYMASGRLTKKSDTYAFGVVVLELVTGRPSMYGSLTLTEWMSQYLAQKRPEVERFIDPKLGEDYDRIQVVKLIILAKHCLQEDRMRRPEVEAIVKVLEKIVEETKC